MLCVTHYFSWAFPYRKPNTEIAGMKWFKFLKIFEKNTRKVFLLVQDPVQEKDIGQKDHDAFLNV